MTSLSTKIERNTNISLMVVLKTTTSWGRLKASEWTEYTKSVDKQLCLNTIQLTPFTVISIVD